MKKRTSDCLIRMVKERTFVVEDIRAGSIRKIEKMITDACGTKIKEYDLWTETDELQEAKVFLRSLREIVIDLLQHLGYRDFQYLYFEYRECNGEHMFGRAYGGLWWQITIRKIGQGHIIIAFVVFQDCSCVKLNIICKPLYGLC